MADIRLSGFSMIDKKLAGFLHSDSLLFKFFHGLMSAGMQPDDNEEERLQKALLSLLAFLGFIAGICLGAHDVYNRYPTMGITTFSYSLVTLIGFIHLKITRKYRLFRFTQLAFVLTMPFIAQMTHGGFHLSGSAIIWSMGAPICAVLFHGPRPAIKWFFAYAVLVLTCVLFDKQAAEAEAVKMLTGSAWFFAGHMLGISFILFLLVQFFTYRIRSEQKRSEALLLNILPAPIAERLKHDQELIADKFSEASILFADIVGFTEFSGRLSPDAVLEILNGVFSRFDELAERHGLEKIKTIGDAYMVVEGLPEPGKNKFGAILRMALDMQKAIEDLNRDAEVELSLRIGIHSGPVIAGVIGIKKFIYDLWGDAVNIASRMESTGIAGEIQVSEATYSKYSGCFNFVSRGLIPVKGKGEMHTYFLRGEKPENEKN